MNRSLAQCSSVDWLHWAVVLIVACDNNSALLPDSVFISAPENNSKNNPIFGGKTDQEKFKFCDDIYLEFLNSFLRNSSVIELINNASNNGFNLIPGTYSKENFTLIVYTERTYRLSFKKFYFDSGLELWGTVSLDLNNNMHINAVIRNTASGDVFDFVYDEKTVPID